MEMEYVTRNEFDLQVKRVEDEEIRQNHRINTLENNIKILNELTISIKTMAVNIENMNNTLTSQGERLGMIEKLPAARWNHFVSGLIGAAATAIGAAIIAAVVHYL